jgi:putative transposase
MERAAVIIGNKQNQWQSTGEVLERFVNTTGKAKEKYLEFALAAKDEGCRDDLGGVRCRAGDERWQGDARVLGDGEFVNQVLKASDEKNMSHEKLKREGWDF